MVARILIFVLIAAVILLYIAVINKSFLRCPHCLKIGAWRFDDLESPHETLDEDGNLIAASVRQRCRGCGDEVLQTWSDAEGRAIKKITRQSE